MDTHYQPNIIESAALEYWKTHQLGAPTSEGSPYCIMLPPPNVTGSLHMGHGFQLTLMDILARWHRMRGDRTLWQPGTDHAGIATQMVVERNLALNGIDRKTLGRDAFVEAIWDWKEQSGRQIETQIERMGASVDWTRHCFTLDKTRTHAVTQAFIQLYEAGLIYRGKRLANWDCKLQTAVSDLEVSNETRQGHLWHIRYEIVESTEASMIVATTRPETLLGDTAIAVHPHDARYQHLIGQHVRVPLTQRTIPVIADEAVDPEFGSGCVKITPAHDFNDYAMGQRHQLPLINILNLDGSLNHEVPEAFQGLDRFKAREHILEALTEHDQLVHTESHTLTVPIGDRSGTLLEPLLTDQWFMSMETLAPPAIEAVRSGDIQFVPKNWENTYFRWLESIQDWCISRQLWWGHRIPAWYDNQGHCYVGASESEVRTQHQLDQTIELTQDPDVLDTWFSSALWPFSTLGWPEKTDDLSIFFPSTTLVTGFDIIFFWVARMIMMSLYFTQQVPFNTVYITGLIRDGSGQKMSKSKGNVIDPIDLIEGIDQASLIEKRTQYLMQPDMKAQVIQHTQQEFPQGIEAAGTDAVRLTYCALASTGRDIRFDLNRLTGYRNFCNKLWNACRYLHLTLNDSPLDTWQPPQHLINRWIAHEAHQLIKTVSNHIETFRFDLLAHTLYDFTWSTYCDWYVECTKDLLSSTPDIQSETRATLRHIMSIVLRLLHPIIPFITHEIWHTNPIWHTEYGSDISRTPLPNIETVLIDTEASDTMNWLQSFITTLRTIRAELGISPSRTIPLILSQGTSIDLQMVQSHQTLMMQLAKLESIEWLDEGAPPPVSATGLVGSLECLVPLAGLINPATELSRIEKALLKLEKKITPLKQRLDQAHYRTQAPQSVVEKTERSLSELQQQHQALSKKYTLIQTLSEGN